MEEKASIPFVCDMLSAFLWHSSATHISCGDILMSNRIGIEESIAIFRPVVLGKSFFFGGQQLHLERANEDTKLRKFLHLAPLSLMRYLLADVGQKKQRETPKTATQIFLHSTTPDEENSLKNYHLRSASVDTFPAHFTLKRSLKVEIISYCANTP
jgi:hypothetical protein